MTARRLWLVVGIGAWVAAFAWLRMADPDLPPPGPVIEGVDLDIYFFPAVSFLHRSLLAGELALWNPYQLAGSPFAAAHSPGALYPGLLPFALLPPDWALTLHALVHLALAAGWASLFARRLGVATAPALIAGIVYVGSAPVVEAVHNTAYLSTYAWLPGVFWAVEGVVSSPRVRSGVVLALCLSLGFLGGHAQGFWYLGLAGALYAVFRTLDSTPQRRWPRVASVLVGSALAMLGLTAVQWIATADYALTGTRDLAGLTLEQAALFPLKGPELWRGVAGVGTGQVALPLLSLPLAVASLANPTLRRTAIAFAVLAALALDFTRGAEGFAFPFLFELPGGNLFRLPYRMAFVFQFAAGVVLAIGADAVLRRLDGRGRWSVLVGIGLVVAIAGDGLARNPMRWRFDPWVGADALYGPRSLVEFAKTAGYDRLFIERMINHDIPDRIATTHGFFAAPDYDPLLPGAYARYFGIETIWHGDLDVAAFPARPRRAALRVDPSLLDLMSVRYYVDAVVPGRVHASLAETVGGPRVGPESPPIYRRDAALPRGYIVHDAFVSRSDDDALAVVRAGRFDPTREVVLTRSVDLEPSPAGGESAAIARYEPRRVELDATCVSRCLLVLTDLWDPDWRATVDGQPAETLRANFLFRAVPLAPGRHRVRYNYRPRALRIGVPVTTVAAILALAAWIWDPPRRSRTVAPPPAAA